MKRQPLFLVLIILALPCLMGMGSLSGGSPDKIPVPAKKFKATLVDQSDTIADCRDVSIEGGTFIEGKRGEGTYTIPFEGIKSVQFLLKGERLIGVIRLSDGNQMELVLNKGQKAYGLTKYGTFQIPLGDLKKILF